MTTQVTHVIEPQISLFHCFKPTIVLLFHSLVISADNVFLHKYTTFYESYTTNYMFKFLYNFVIFMTTLCIIVIVFELSQNKRPS